MTLKTIGRHKGLAYSVLAAFAMLVLPAGLYPASAGPAAGTGTLTGFVFGQDIKTPVSGAVVKIRNMGDQKELASRPTDANGMFTILGIPEGRYFLGVTSDQGDFNFDYSIHIKAGELGKLSLALSTQAPGQEPAKPAPPKKVGFFNTVAGRALIITVVGVGVYFLFFNETSPNRR
jgi:hypothetical protein